MAKLDNSYCDHSARPSFLSLIQSDECMSNDDTKYHNKLLLDWVILRGLKIIHVCCESEFECHIWKAYLQMGDGARYVRSFELNCSLFDTLPCKCLESLTCERLSNKVCDLIELNPNLQTLTVTEHDHAIARTINAPMLRNLKVETRQRNLERGFYGEHFLVFYPPAPPDPFVSFLPIVAVNLHRLTLHCQPLKINFADLTVFVEGCVQLDYLEIENRFMSDEQLIGLTGKCPQLTSLVVAASGNITDQGIEETVKQLQLRYVSLRHCTKLTDITLSHLFKHCASTLVELCVDDRLELLFERHNPGICTSTWFAEVHYSKKDECERNGKFK